VSVGPAVAAAVDLLDEARFDAARGALEIRMRPRTVRMLGIERR
jgi:hypothetical protein